jgi:post-segregation antitoxin (ccd killing protein)
MIQRPRRKFNRKAVQSTVDEPVLQTLHMLGFNVPRLIEELLSNVADHKRCPCCGREVKPVITGRNIKRD